MDNERKFLVVPPALVDFMKEKWGDVVDIIPMELLPTTTQEHQDDKQ